MDVRIGLLFLFVCYCQTKTIFGSGCGNKSVCALCDGDYTLRNHENSCDLGVRNPESPNSSVKIPEGCTILHDGPCVEKDQCKIQCPATFAPVCAQSGDTYKTFSGECDILKYNACQGGNFKQVELGKCTKMV